MFYSGIPLCIMKCSVKNVKQHFKKGVKLSSCNMKLTTENSLSLLVERHNPDFHNNCAFCDKSMKFGVDVDYHIWNKFG